MKRHYLFQKRKVILLKLVPIACIDNNKLKILNDKSKTYTKLNEFNIPTAEWALIKNKEELKKTILYFEKYGGAVIKPCR